jgi:hypothetical protein
MSTRAPPIPRKMILDSQYGVCFRACMRQVLEIIGRDDKRHRLDIVIEDGHQNVGGPEVAPEGASRHCRPARQDQGRQEAALGAADGRRLPGIQLFDDSDIGAERRPRIRSRSTGADRGKPV